MLKKKGNIFEITLKIHFNNYMSASNSLCYKIIVKRVERDRK